MGPPSRTCPRAEDVWRASAKARVILFHTGNRCIGNRLAELQLKILWEEIPQRFHEIHVVEEPPRVGSSFVHVYAPMKVVIPRRHRPRCPEGVARPNCLTPRVI